MASGIIVFATVFVSNRDAGNRKRFAAIVSVALGGHPGHTVELPPGQWTLNVELRVLRPIADVEGDVEDGQETLHHPDDVLAAHGSRGWDHGPPRDFKL